MNLHLILGVWHRSFSNGLQRYGLFFNLQIFLQYFLQKFSLVFISMGLTTYISDICPLKKFYTRALKRTNH